MAMKPLNPMPTAPTNNVARHPSGVVKNFKPKTAQNNSKLADAKRFIANANSQPTGGMAGPQGGDKYRQALKTIAEARIQNKQALSQGYSSPGQMKRANQPAPVASRKVLSGRSAKTSFEDTNAARAAAGKKPITQQKYDRRQQMSGMNAAERASWRAANPVK